MIKVPQENPTFKPRKKGYAHQDAALAHWASPHYALFWEMGLGKTKTTIEHAAMLFLNGEIDGLLIMAPNTAYLNWIYEEIPAHMPEGINYRLGYYSARSTTESQRQLNKVAHAVDDTLDILAINIEAVNTVNGFHAVGIFVTNHYVMCVIDESSRIKSPIAKRTKAAHAIGRRCDYRRILSGTPMTQNPLDLWTQLEFLKPGLSGHRSFSSFRSYYAKMVTMQMGSRAFNKIVGFRNLEDLQELLKDVADRKMKIDCLDLPEKIFENVYVEQTPEQRRAYNNLRQSALHELDQGVVTVTDALSVLLRLHQINCGHVKMDDGTIVDIPSNRLTMLLDLVEDISGKVIIWARFRHDITTIAAALNEKYGQESVALFYGATSKIERLESMRRFKDDPRCRFFVANPASAGMSLTLVSAHVAIYYSLSYSLEEWLQSQDRNHRIGQDRAVTYQTLMVRDTVDEKVVRALMAKQDLTNGVLDGLRSLLE